MKPWLTCAEVPSVAGRGQHAALLMRTRHMPAAAEPAGPAG
jgi:hypothetical protein